MKNSRTIRVFQQGAKGLLVWLLFLCAVIGLSFFKSESLSLATDAQFSLPAIVDTVFANLSSPGLSDCLIALVVIWLMIHEVAAPPFDIMAGLLSFLFGCFLLLARSFRIFGDFRFIKASVNHLLIVCICFIGITVVLYGLVKAVNARVLAYRGQNHPVRAVFYTEHIICFVSILFFWLLFELAFFPGSVPQDGRSQLLQYDGVFEISTIHSYAGTLLIGAVFHVMRAVFSDKYAVAGYILLQNLVCAAVFTSITMYVRAKDRKASWFCWFFYAIVPMWWASAQAIIKDTLYFAAFAYFLLQVFIIYEGNSKIIVLFKLFFCALLVCVLRNDGMYVAIPTVLVLLPAVKQKSCRRSLSVLSVLLIVSALFFQMLLPRLADVKKARIWEPLSVPCQQIALCVVEHNEELTEEDRAFIDKYFLYDEIQEKYRPGISDPIKNRARIQNPDAQEMRTFWHSWYSLLCRFPRTYIKAFLAGTWGYLDPFYITSDALQYNFYNKSAISAADEQIVYSSYYFSDSIRHAVSQYATLWNKLPLLSVLVMPGIYSWFVLYVAFDSVFRHHHRTFLLLTPVFLIILICFGSPVNGYLRYMLPVCAVTPLYLLPVLTENSSLNITGNISGSPSGEPENE